MIEDRFIYALLPIPFIILTAIIFIRRKDLRRRIIKVGIVGGFAGWASNIWYFIDYWRPPSMVLGRPALFTIEDFVVGFTMMAVGMTLYPFLTGKKAPSIPKGRKKFLLISTILLWVLPFVFFVNILKFPSPFISFAIVSIYIIIMLVQYPKLIKQSLIIGGIFVALGGLVYFFMFNIFSTGYLDRYFLLTDEWYNPTLLGFYPLLELLWYFTWGAFAGVFIDYLALRNAAKSQTKASKALS